MAATIITVGPAPSYTPDKPTATASLSRGVTFKPTPGNPFVICADSSIGNSTHHDVTAEKHFDLTGHKVGDVINYSTTARHELYFEEVDGGYRQFHHHRYQHARKEVRRPNYTWSRTTRPRSRGADVAANSH